MPIVEMIHENDPTVYTRLGDIERLIQYIARPEATQYYDPNAGFKKGYLIGAAPNLVDRFDCRSIFNVIQLMQCCCAVYQKEGTRLLRHRVISFGDGEWQDPELARRLAQQVVDYYYRRGYMAFYGIHLDTEHTHIHIAVCTVNVDTGRRYNQFYEVQALRQGIDLWYYNATACGNFCYLEACIQAMKEQREYSAQTQPQAGEMMGKIA